MEHQNKVAVVTGAAQGMGRAVSERLASGGAKLALYDINGDALAQAVTVLRANGTEVIAIEGSVTSSTDVTQMIETVLSRYKMIHILVNNAGVLKPSKVIDIEEEEWDFVVGVNLKGTYLCSRAVLPTMHRLGWGRIINFSSTAGKNVSTVGGAHYTAAKAGILGFTRHLAKEEASYGITVNAVCPGLIDTEMIRSIIDQAKAEAYADSFPIKRLGQPREVAELVTFLASEKASYITGASFDINGGDLMI